MLGSDWSEGDDEFSTLTLGLYHMYVCWGRGGGGVVVVLEGVSSVNMAKLKDYNNVMNKSWNHYLWHKQKQRHFRTQCWCINDGVALCAAASHQQIVDYFLHHHPNCFILYISIHL